MQRTSDKTTPPIEQLRNRWIKPGNCLRHIDVIIRSDFKGLTIVYGYHVYQWFGSYRGTLHCWLRDHLGTVCDLTRIGDSKASARKKRLWDLGTYEAIAVHEDSQMEALDRLIANSFITFPRLPWDEIDFSLFGKGTTKTSATEELRELDWEEEGFEIPRIDSEQNSLDAVDDSLKQNAAEFYDLVRGLT